jgi:hypothetical protein
MRAAALALAAVVAAAAVPACRGTSTPPAPPAPRDAFEAYPALAHIPADTSYAFVTFKPMPVAIVRRMYEAIVGFRTKVQATAAGGTVDALLGSFTTVVGGYDQAHLAELGFDPTPRMAVYAATGFYPAFRLEIADRTRLVSTIEKVVTGAGLALPASVEDRGVRYWRFPDVADVGVVVGVTETELVIAVAPRANLDRDLDLVLGVRPPPNAIAPEVFRELAARNGLTSRGLGFVDMPQLVAWAAAKAAPQPPGCREAIATSVQSVPRIVFGYDVVGQNLTNTVVVELAPPLVAELRKLATQIPPFVEPSDRHPVMSIVVAVDVDRALALAPAIDASFREYRRLCRPGDPPTQQVPTPTLPPPFAGIRGGALSVTNFTLDAHGEVDGLEGVAVLHVANPAAFADAVGQQIGLAPGTVRIGGGAVQLLPGVLPYEVHAGISASSVAFAVGPTSRADVETVLASTASLPAPFARLGIDAEQLAELPVQPGEDEHALDGYGLGAVDISVEDFGVVMRATLEMK